MRYSKLIEVLNLYPRLKKLVALAIGIALLLIILALVERSDRAIVERQSRQGFAVESLPQPFDAFTADERRIAHLFIADTLPRLMNKGLITRYERNAINTNLLVAGRVWKARSRFVKESLMTAVSVYNRVNGFSAWTRIVDDHTGMLYAQVLPSDRKELYE
jgi:hypothetical protein